MANILNLISIVSAFVFGAGVLYWIMDITIGRIKILHSQFEWHGLQVKDFIFLAVSVFLILFFFDFYKPY